MFEIDQFQDNCYLFKSSYWFLNSGFYLEEDGWAVIDPGFSPSELMQLREYMKDKDTSKKYLIYTHSDFDHITGGYYFPEAQKVAQASFEHCSKDAQVDHLREADEACEIERPDFVFPSIDVTFEDKLDLQFPKVSISLLAAPGHTRDSLFVLIKDKGVLFSGDTLSDNEFPLVMYNSDKYIETLKMAKSLVEKYDLKYVVPGHGSIAKGSSEILKRIDVDIDYLENLTGQAEDLFFQGLATIEIKDVLKGMHYKGDYVGEELMPAHERNIDLVIEEAGDKLC